jgi:hypothetical protein
MRKFSKWLCLGAAALLVTGASVATWNAAFEVNTTNSTPVSTLDDRINEIKESVRDRVETELCFGSGFTGSTTGCGTADTGRSREGMARGYHVADCSTVIALNINDRAGVSALGSNDDGRLCVDSDTGETYYWTGSAWAPVNTGFRGALVYNVADVAVGNAAVTPIPFSDEKYDVGGWHSVSTNTQRLTVITGVTKVRLSCQLDWGVDADGIRKVNILKNGDEAIGLPMLYVHASNQAGWDLSVPITSAVVPTTAGDYFTCVGYHEAGGALDVFGDVEGSPENTWFSIEEVN